MMELLVGACVGACGLFFLQKFRLRSLHALGTAIITTAEKEATTAREKKELAIEKLEFAWAQKKQEEMIRLEKFAKELESEKKIFEEKVHKEKRALDTARKDLEKETHKIRKEQELVTEQLAEGARTLSAIAGYSQNEARAVIERKMCEELESEYLSQLAQKIHSAEIEAKEKSLQLILTAIPRAIHQSMWKVATTTLLLPNEEMKAKIIGKEGRNIRTFESITGVTLLIDEQPNSITLSSFDPVRRLIAKEALSALMVDGRITPSRIEETVREAEKKIDLELVHIAQEALVTAKVPHLHPDMLFLLGKLSTRTSLGQNVLDHSIEVSALMALLAQELKLNVERARRIGLLHDIGKAMSGTLSHALAGYHMALKCGEDEFVANGIGCHHDEMAPTSPEGALCKFADAISASRPGARVDSIEKHLTRLHDLEGIATTFEGVHTAYALDAGREVRVFVCPERVDDLQALSLARRIAKKIEEHSSLGRVQITVIREKRVVEYTSP